MQRGSNHEFQAVLAELQIHAALLGQGLNVFVHPDTPGTTKKVDFLAMSRSCEIYVEVTSFGPTQQTVAVERQVAAVYRAIDAIELPPGHALGFTFVQPGSRNPSIRHICRAIYVWAVSQIARGAISSEEKAFTSNGWIFEISLHGGLSPNTRGGIAIEMGQIRWLGPQLEIRDALATKARRYGALGRPFVIAVADCADEIQGQTPGEALISAAFGDEAVSIPVGLVGQAGLARTTRLSNGFFGTPHRPRNVNVSAVILLPDGDIWRLREKHRQPLILYNPYAIHPIDPSWLALDELTVVDHRVKYTKRGWLADLIGIPSPWPPE
ncbi:MAG: hypothetical protein U1E62_11920 [Alsobacter sp.]